MFINIETRKKLCRLGKRMTLHPKTRREGEWLIKLFIPQKLGRPKAIMPAVEFKRGIK